MTDKPVRLGNSSKATTTFFVYASTEAVARARFYGLLHEHGLVQTSYTVTLDTEEWKTSSAEDNRIAPGA